MAELTIEGVDELIAQLENLTYKQGEQVLSKSLKRGSQLISEEIQHRAPVRSGRLANSVRVKITEKSATEAIALIGPTRRGFYGSFQEFGTRYQDREPFVGPAFDAVNDEAYAVIAFDLSQEITKAIKKNG